VLVVYFNATLNDRSLAGWDKDFSAMDSKEQWTAQRCRLGIWVWLLS